MKNKQFNLKLLGILMGVLVGAFFGLNVNSAKAITCSGGPYDPAHGGNGTGCGTVTTSIGLYINLQTCGPTSPHSDSQSASYPSSGHSNGYYWQVYSGTVNYSFTNQTGQGTYSFTPVTSLTTPTIPPCPGSGSRISSANASAGNSISVSLSNGSCANTSGWDSTKCTGTQGANTYWVYGQAQADGLPETECMDSVTGGYYMPNGAGVCKFYEYSPTLSGSWNGSGSATVYQGTSATLQFNYSDTGQSQSVINNVFVAPYSSSLLLPAPSWSLTNLQAP